MRLSWFFTIFLVIFCFTSIGFSAEIVEENNGDLTAIEKSLRDEDPLLLLVVCGIENTHTLWNLYRELNSQEIVIDGASYSDSWLDALSQRLQHGDFSRFDLCNITLRNLNFSDATFKNATLVGALIENCTLTNVQGDGVVTSDTQFINCDLTGSYFRFVKPKRGTGFVSVEHSTLHSSRWENPETSMEFLGCVMGNVWFPEERLPAISIQRAKDASPDVLKQQVFQTWMQNGFGPTAWPQWSQDQVAQVLLERRGDIDALKQQLEECQSPPNNVILADNTVTITKLEADVILIGGFYELETTLDPNSNFFPANSFLIDGKEVGIKTQRREGTQIYDFALYEPPLELTRDRKHTIHLEVASVFKLKNMSLDCVDNSAQSVTLVAN